MEDNSSLSGAIIFETERLVCRRWRPSDIDAIFDVYSDLEGSRWVGDGSPITRNECELWLQVTANNYRVRGYGMFALDDRGSNETLGFCGLVHPNNQTDAEIKYAFLPVVWGQGLASEIVPAMIAYGAKKHRLAKIIATVAPENIASQRVLLKAGLAFVEEKNDEDGKPVKFYDWFADSMS